MLGDTNFIHWITKTREKTKSCHSGATHTRARHNPLMYDNESAMKLANKSVLYPCHRIGSTSFYQRHKCYNINRKLNGNHDEMTITPILLPPPKTLEFDQSIKVLWKMIFHFCLTRAIITRILPRVKFEVNNNFQSTGQRCVQCSVIGSTINRPCSISYSMSINIIFPCCNFHIQRNCLNSQSLLANRTCIRA